MLLLTNQIVNLDLAGLARGIDGCIHAPARKTVEAAQITLQPFFLKKPPSLLLIEYIERGLRLDPKVLRIAHRLVGCVVVVDFRQGSHAKRHAPRNRAEFRHFADKYLDFDVHSFLAQVLSTAGIDCGHQVNPDKSAIS